MKSFRFSFIVLILLIPLLAYNQTLTSKKQQLEELKSQLKQQEELIEQAKAKKHKNQSKLNELENKRKALERKLKKMKASEAEAKKKIQQTEAKLKKTGAKLSELDALCEKEYKKLCQAYYLKAIHPEKEFDARLLAALILRTAEEIDDINTAKSGLEKEKKAQNKRYENLIWSRIIEKKRGKKYSAEVALVKEDLTRLTISEKEARKRYNELQKAVKELNSLIAKLQSELKEQEYSFKFSSERLPWPVDGKLIRGFGEQPTEKYKVSVLNNGIDIAVPEGTEVCAVESGVVAFAQWYTGAGKLVIIDHKNGFFSLYSHNSSILVTKGDSVEKSQKIALSGKSGSAEIPFLHFEIRRRGKPVDPLLYLEGK